MEKQYCIGCNRELAIFKGAVQLDKYCNNPSCVRYGLLTIFFNIREKDEKEKIKDA